jgi:ATP adenylyltransferase
VANDKIWAPWRLAYVQGQDRTQAEQRPVNLLPGGAPQCFMCRAAALPDEDRASGVVYRGQLALAMLNRYPYTNGHLLVAPLAHVARLDQLGHETQLELLQIITRLVGTLERTLRADGFNVGLNLGRAAGAGLPGHLHWHIVPRWNGDTNFMPTLAGVNVIPQSLEAVWELLVTELAKERGEQTTAPRPDAR